MGQNADTLDQALRLIEAFAQAPLALGGLRLRGWHGPRRSALLARLRAQCLAAHDGALGWHTLPCHTEAERLAPGIDLSASLARGVPVMRTGLLDQLEGGVVVMSMAERASPALACALGEALDAGRIALVLLDEALDDEPGPWGGLLDRMALCIDLRDESAWRELDGLPEGVSAALTAPSAALGRRRERPGSGGREIGLPWRAVQLSDADLGELCRAAQLLGIESFRPVLQAVSLARLHAGLEAVNVARQADLAFAIRHALLPRARSLPAPAEAPESAQTDDAVADDGSPPPPPPPQPDPQPQADPPEASADPVQPPPDPQSLPDGAAERLVEAALASLPAGLLALLAAQAGARGVAPRSAGSGSLAAAGRGRGRSIGARRGLPRGNERLHLFASLRAALPWQRLRAAGLTPAAPAFDSPGRQAPRIHFRPDDLHVHREQHRRATTTVFVVDASGSTALQRLAEAKGAVELLLADCYVRRDRVALVSFRGAGAELLLPPTRSLVAARRSLAGLPGGGGSPVAAGLELAARVIDQLTRAGDDTQLVVLTDGRANLSRNGQPGRQRAAQEAQAMARRLAVMAGHRVLLDTSMRPEPAAQSLAQALGARYLPMPFARAQAIRDSIRLATA